MGKVKSGLASLDWNHAHASRYVETIARKRFSQSMGNSSYPVTDNVMRGLLEEAVLRTSPGISALF
ncbi:hypothetical protein [Paenibacillus sp. NPDC093718]|uniref:hypothetical protein n=1 Tax=Paenibacillus sp. NPDC093718 TaxID=3390601 RepID=UPI003D02A707